MMRNDGPRQGWTSEWRKASYSNPNDNCVEVHVSRKSLRDTKDPSLTALDGNVLGLLAAIKANAPGVTA